MCPHQAHQSLTRCPLLPAHLSFKEMNLQEELDFPSSFPLRSPQCEAPAHFGAFTTNKGA